MKNKNEIHDELSELSPFLEKMKGMDEGFQVPNDYFRSLPDEVMKRVRPEVSETTEPEQNWFNGFADFLQNLFQPKYALAYASVAVLIVAGSYLLGGENESDEFQAVAKIEIEDLSDETIENYLAENIETVSTDVFEDYFADGEIQTLPEIELEQMEEYLDEELDDLRLDDLQDLL